jgi:membrane protein DedA with SNARE-associated domain
VTTRSRRKRALTCNKVQPNIVSVRVSAHEITHLIHEYGLIVVFLAAGAQAVGFPVPGGTALVVAGADASTKHGLPLGWVIVVGAVGALIGTTAGFALGRWRGEPILLRLGRLFRRRPGQVQALRERFQEHGAVPVFIARFITGARNVAGLVAGASGMPLARFFLVSAAAAAAWSSLITLEYYFAGRAILGAPTWVQIVLIIVGVIVTIVSFRLLRPAAAQSDQVQRASVDG